MAEGTTDRGPRVVTGLRRDSRVADSSGAHGGTTDRQRSQIGPAETIIPGFIP